MSAHVLRLIYWTVKRVHNTLTNKFKIYYSSYNRHTRLIITETATLTNVAHFGILNGRRNGQRAISWTKTASHISSYTCYSNESTVVVTVTAKTRRVAAGTMMTMIMIIE